MPPCSCLSEINNLQGQISLLKTRLDKLFPSPSRLHMEAPGPTPGTLFALDLGVDGPGPTQGAFARILGGPFNFFAVPGDKPLGHFPDANGNMLLGYGGAVAGTANGPFPAIAMTDVDPTGVPNVPAGMTAFVFNRLNLRLWFYVNQGPPALKGWHFIQGA